MEQKLFYLASNAPFLLAGIGEAGSMIPLKSDIRHGNRQLGLSEAGFLCLVKGSGLPASQAYGQGGHSTTTFGFLAHRTGLFSLCSFAFCLSLSFSYFSLNP